MITPLFRIFLIVLLGWTTSAYADGRYHNLIISSKITSLTCYFQQPADYKHGTHGDHFFKEVGRNYELVTTVHYSLVHEPSGNSSNGETFTIHGPPMDGPKSASTNLGFKLHHTFGGSHRVHWSVPNRPESLAILVTANEKYDWDILDRPRSGFAYSHAVIENMQDPNLMSIVALLRADALSTQTQLIQERLKTHLGADVGKLAMKLAPENIEVASQAFNPRWGQAAGEHGIQIGWTQGQGGGYLLTVNFGSGTVSTNVRIEDSTYTDQANSGASGQSQSDDPQKSSGSGTQAPPPYQQSSGSNSGNLAQDGNPQQTYSGTSSGSGQSSYGSNQGRDYSGIGNPPQTSSSSYSQPPGQPGQVSGYVPLPGQGQSAGQNPFGQSGQVWGYPQQPTQAQNAGQGQFGQSRVWGYPQQPGRGHYVNPSQSGQQIQGQPSYVDQPQTSYQVQSAPAPVVYLNQGSGLDMNINPNTYTGQQQLEEIREALAAALDNLKAELDEADADARIRRDQARQHHQRGFWE